MREVQEFSISLQNRYSALAQETDLSVDAMNECLTSISTECAEVGGTVIREDTSKLFQGTKISLGNVKIMIASNTTHIIELQSSLT